MRFNIEKLIDDELTKGTELGEYICENYKRIPDGRPEINGIKRLVINVMSDDDELLDPQFTFIEKVMSERHCRELWVCWIEREGELYEWWITGDNC